MDEGANARQSFAKCNWTKFSDTLKESNGRYSNNALDSEPAIDARADEIAKSITQAIDVACPKQSVKDYAFRLRPTTVSLIRLKRKLRRKSQKSNDPLYRTLYNNVSRQVKAAITAERQKAWAEATASLDETDGREFWRKFKTFTGVSQSSVRAIRLNGENGTIVTDEAAVANMFAESLGRIHMTHNGPEFCDTTKAEIELHVRERMANYTPNFTLVIDKSDTDPLTGVITVTEVKAALRGCKGTSAPGPDGIPYSVIKKVPQCTFDSLVELYTACLAVGYFPRAWKSAIGVMLPKPDKDSKVVTNYRPISLLNVIGKLFEKVIVTRMHMHFSATSFFNPYQRAYLKKKEATEHVYRLGDEIRAAKAKGWITTAVSLDVEKAFDAAWHDAIRYKLHVANVPVRLVRLVSSFLTDRTISVRVNGELSRPVSLGAGTPQGSVMSPLLYLVYVNDLPIQPRNNCRAGQFADDMSLWTSYPNKRVTFLRLQRCLDEIERWCSKWRIKLNVAKTQLVSFSRSKLKLQLKLFGQCITEQNELKLLGVCFDRDLLLTGHCKSKASKAVQRVRLLRLVSGQTWGANARTLLKLYKQYIRPVLETGYVVTSRCHRTNLRRLQLVQNTALRTALRAKRRTRIEDLHRDANIVPIAERLERLRERAIVRFGDSEGIQSLENFKALLSD